MLTDFNANHRRAVAGTAAAFAGVLAWFPNGHQEARADVPVGGGPLLPAAAPLRPGNGVTPDDVHIVDTPPASPRLDPILRARMRALVSGDATHRLPPERDALALLTDPDAEIRRLAAILILRGDLIASDDPDPDDAPRSALQEALQEAPREALQDTLRAAPPRDLREIAEAVEPGLDVALIPAVRAILERPDRATTWVFCDLVAKGPPGVAEVEIDRVLDLLPPSDRNVPHLIDRLARVGSADSGARLGAILACGARESRAAAARAITAIHDRLLGVGELQDADRLLAAVHTEVPRDWAITQLRARLHGLYLGETELGDNLLAAEAARRATLSGFPEVTASLELALGISVIRFFSGDSSGAVATLEAALARCQPPPAHATAAATAWSRLHLFSALLAIDAGDDSRAAPHFAAAINDAPYDGNQCGFDNAWSGVFGLQTCLDRLRRTGRLDLSLRYLAALDNALGTEDDGRIGIPAEATGEAPPGSDEAVYQGSLVRSWIPWLRATTMVHAGQFDEAAACARRVIAYTESSDVFANRNLAAQIGLALGDALRLGGDTSGAARAYERSAARLDELGKAWLDSDMLRQVALLPTASPPVPTPLSAVAADAWTRAAEARARLGDEDTAMAQLDAARRHTPGSPRAALLHARRYAISDPARAQRVLSAIPLSAATALDRARLLSALGREEDAAATFEIHLSWNATSEAHRLAEVQLHATDPWW